MRHPDYPPLLMKLRSQLARIPRAVVLGLLELNCDWFRIATSQKSFLGSGSQTLFSAKPSDRRKYIKGNQGQYSDFGFYLKQRSSTLNNLMGRVKTIWEPCVLRARPSVPFQRVANGHIWFFTERDWSQECCHGNKMVGVILFLL